MGNKLEALIESYKALTALRTTAAYNALFAMQGDGFQGSGIMGRDSVYFHRRHHIWSVFAGS